MKKLLVAASAVLAFSAANSASAAALVNGSFEGGPASNFGTYYRGPLAPDGWSRVAGLEAPDIVDDAYTQAGAGFAVLLDPHHGDRFLDMNGASATGGLFQDISGLTVGSTITVTYWVGQWAQNSAGVITASLAGSTAATQVVTVPFNNAAQSATWTLHTLSGIAQASTVRLQFVGAAPSCCSVGAPALDDVSLSVTGGVPEPATWALMIGGFGLAGSALRRRRLA